MWSGSQKCVFFLFKSVFYFFCSFLQNATEKRSSQDPSAIFCKTRWKNEGLKRTLFSAQILDNFWKLIPIRIRIVGGPKSAKVFVRGISDSPPPYLEKIEKTNCGHYFDHYFDTISPNYCESKGSFISVTEKKKKWSLWTKNQLISADTNRLSSKVCVA